MLRRHQGLEPIPPSYSPPLWVAGVEMIVGFVLIASVIALGALAIGLGQPIDDGGRGWSQFSCVVFWIVSSALTIFAVGALMAPLMSKAERDEEEFWRG